MASFATSHLNTLSVRRNRSGCNGVLPWQCLHESLCRTRECLAQGGGQVLQIGHWVACPSVPDQAVSLGNPMYGSLISDTATLVATELVPGSMDALVSWSQAATVLDLPGVKLQRERTDMLWYPVPSSAAWQRGAPADALQTTCADGLKVFSWPAKDYFLKQVAQSSPFAIAWHLILNDRRLFVTAKGVALSVASTKKGPDDMYLASYDKQKGGIWTRVSEALVSVRPLSDYFVYRDTGYWSFDLDDHFRPRNDVELKKGLQEVCTACRDWLNGPPLTVQAPMAAPVAPLLASVEAQQAGPVAAPKAAPRPVAEVHTCNSHEADHDGYTTEPVDLRLPVPTINLLRCKWLTKGLQGLLFLAESKCCYTAKTVHRAYQQAAFGYMPTVDDQRVRSLAQAAFSASQAELLSKRLLVKCKKT